MCGKNLRLIFNEECKLLKYISRTYSYFCWSKFRWNTWNWGCLQSRPSCPSSFSPARLIFLLLSLYFTEHGGFYLESIIYHITASLSMKRPRLAVAVLFTVRSPWTRVGWYIPNLTNDQFFTSTYYVDVVIIVLIRLQIEHLVMIFAPAPFPRPTTLEK